MKAPRIAIELLSICLVACLGGCTVTTSGGASSGGASPATPAGSQSPGPVGPAGSGQGSHDGAGGSTEPGPTVSPPGDKITGPYVLFMRQTGGIAALHMETTLDTAAKTITYGGLRNQKLETRDVSPEEISVITRAIDNARLSSFQGTLKGAAPADAFSYEMTIREGGREHTLKWADGAQVPPAIEQVHLALVQLRDSKFRAGGSGGSKE
jgi:hypothetical protein